MTIRGTVESIGEGHATPNSPANHCNGNGHPADSTGCIEVWGQNVVIDGGTLSANKDVNTQCNGREWIEVFAEQNVTIRGGSSFALQASHPCANTQTAGVITVMAQNGDVTMSGNALEADAVAAGGDGGILTVQAGGNVNLSTAVLRARGDSVQTGGYGNGGMASIRSFTGTLSWTNGEGDVSPTGDFSGPPPQAALPAANRGVITLQDCTTGPVDVSGTAFPSLGTPTVPTKLSDACGGKPAIPGYVTFNSAVWDAVVEPPPPEGQTFSGRKFDDLQGDGVNESGDPGLGGWEIRAYADDAPQNGVLDAAEFDAGPVATDFTAPWHGCLQLHPRPGQLHHLRGAAGGLDADVPDGRAGGVRRPPEPGSPGLCRHPGRRAERRGERLRQHAA